jgi:ATP-dependent DNA helicase RecG
MHAFGSSEPLEPEPGSGPRPSVLDTPLEVKPVRAGKAAEALGLLNVGDLLEHFPREHADRREARTIASLSAPEDVTVIAEVRRISTRRARGRLTMQQATVVDETGPLKAVWFNQPWLVDRLSAGTRVVLHGRYGGPRRGLAVKEHEVAPDATATHSTGVVPVYRATENLPSTRIRELAWNARPAIRHVVEPLPAWLRLAERLPDRPAAVDAIHFPEDEAEEPEARRRLAFEELFLLELSLAARKRARQSELRAPAVEGSGELVDPWLVTLPFALTGDQRVACAAIDADLATERPMQRLLMGEVGSGKTVVALHAMLRAVEGDRQAVLMAPTETLAEQHLATLDRLLGGHVPIALLTGSTPAGRRRELLGRLASGELSLLVGTHALLEPAVEFRDLGLVVVDEQHRFGVRQRAALEAKSREGIAPHALHMTATPIPRTLELTVYGDLDVTTLHELPAGRLPTETFVVDGARARARAYERAREEIAAGHQVFVVCPLVVESEALQAKAATAEAERLQRTEFRDQRVALIHGQMSARQKQEAMRAFAGGAADVLVATSVIEVGIDVPNATVMLIEAAERYGLSQLHQLRGRIGRGEHASVCILFGDPTLPRLRAIAEGRDGFRLAEVDLELRGAGDVLGTRQHGLPQFRVARIPEDAALLECAKRRAEELLDRDPLLESPEHALLRDAAAVLEPIPA